MYARPAPSPPPRPVADNRAAWDHVAFSWGGQAVPRGASLPKTNVGGVAQPCANLLKSQPRACSCLPKILYSRQSSVVGLQSPKSFRCTRNPEILSLWRCYRLLQPCVEHGVPLTHVAGHHDVPLRTLQLWLAQYRREGLAGLARRRRRDRGQPHGLPPELRQLIEGLALRKPPPTAALVSRQVRDVAQHHGWPVPNYHRVYRIIKQLAPALLTLAHAGSHTYRTTYDLL